MARDAFFSRKDQTSWQSSPPAPKSYLSSSDLFQHLCLSSRSIRQLVARLLASLLAGMRSLSRLMWAVLPRPRPSLSTQARCMECQQIQSPYLCPSLVSLPAPMPLEFPRLQLPWNSLRTERFFFGVCPLPQTHRVKTVFFDASLSSSLELHLTHHSPLCDSVFTTVFGFWEKKFLTHP